MTFFAEISSSAISSYRRKVLYNSVAECFLALELRSRSEGFRDRQTKTKEKRKISSLAQAHTDSFDDGKIFFLLTQSSWWYN